MHVCVCAYQCERNTFEPGELIWEAFQLVLLVTCGGRAMPEKECMCERVYGRLLYDWKEKVKLVTASRS